MPFMTNNNNSGYSMYPVPANLVPTEQQANFLQLISAQETQKQLELQYMQQNRNAAIEGFQPLWRFNYKLDDSGKLLPLATTTVEKNNSSHHYDGSLTSSKEQQPNIKPLSPPLNSLETTATTSRIDEYQQQLLKDNVSSDDNNNNARLADDPIELQAINFEGYFMQKGDYIVENLQAHPQLHSIHNTEDISSNISQQQSAGASDSLPVINNQKASYTSSSSSSDEPECNSIDDTTVSNPMTPFNPEAVRSLNRYVILPGGMFVRPKDIYVESLPNGQGRQIGGCIAMSLENLLIRYDALDRHYYRLKEENAKLRSIIFDFYRASLSTSVHSKIHEEKNNQLINTLSNNTVQQNNDDDDDGIKKEEEEEEDVSPSNNVVNTLCEDAPISSNNNKKISISHSFKPLLHEKNISSSSDVISKHEAAILNRSNKLKSHHHQLIRRGTGKYQNIISPVKQFITTVNTSVETSK